MGLNVHSMDESVEETIQQRRRHRRRRLKEKTLPVLPTLLTLGNGVSGLAAITLATSGYPDVVENRLVMWAALLVFLGMVCDLFDGQMARLTKQTSRFGAELDSLCDLITFCVAPTFIMLSFNGVLPTRLLWAIAAFYTMAGALRLARFNANKDEHKAPESFVGLPTPAAAGTVASFAIVMPALKNLTDPMMPEATQQLGNWLTSATMVVVPAVTLILAWLMVSRIQYPHLANELTKRRSFSQLVELLFAVILVIVLHELALPLILCYVVFAAPVNQLRLKALLQFEKSRSVIHKLLVRG